MGMFSESSYSQWDKSYSQRDESSYMNAAFLGQLAQMQADQAKDYAREVERMARAQRAEERKTQILLLCED